MEGLKRHHSGPVECILLSLQRRLPSAATVICGPHCHWLIFLLTSQKKDVFNDSANVRMQQQKWPEISSSSSRRWPVFSCQRVNGRDDRVLFAADWALTISIWISTPLPAMLTHATFLSTFTGPTSLLYATTQMSALFPMMNESLFSAHLSCLPAVCPCWRNNLPFPVLHRPKGTPEVTRKETDLRAAGKFRYLIKNTDKGAARWMEDISTERGMKSGSQAQ